MFRPASLLLCSLLGATPAAAQIGTVLGQHKISSTSGGFAGPLHDGDNFGSACAALGDLNGDGVVDLAVGAQFDDDGGPARGAVWILFLDPAGSVRSARKISSLAGFPGVLPDNGGFGTSLAALGDVDGDGFPDLAVGSPDAQSVWVCLLNADGSVRAAQQTSAADAVYSPPMLDHERFGQSLAALGDVDGNGVTDLAVGCPLGGGRTSGTISIWLLRLTPQGVVAGAQQVASSQSGSLTGWEFSWNLAAADLDGDLDVDLVTGGGRAGTDDFSLLELVLDPQQNLVRVDEVPSAELRDTMGITRDTGMGPLQVAGDLDGDGGPELLIGLPKWRESRDVERRGGALTVAFTRPGGSARRTALVASHRGGLDGGLHDEEYFGISLAQLGDLDGDGVGDVAVGAVGDRDGGGEYRGAVWILNLDGSPLRNGSGTNPLTLSEGAEPVMTSPWNLALDCSAHAPGLAYVVACSAPLAGTPSVAGELLVDRTSALVFRAVQAHVGGMASFALPVPLDMALISFGVHVQGLCSGAPGPRLSNALDEILALP